MRYCTELDTPCMSTIADKKKMFLYLGVDDLKSPGRGCWLVTSSDDRNQRCAKQHLDNPDRAVRC
jgi:hypothetical protein